MNYITQGFTLSELQKKKLKKAHQDQGGCTLQFEPHCLTGTDYLTIPLKLSRMIEAHQDKNHHLEQKLGLRLKLSKTALQKNFQEGFLAEINFVPATLPTLSQVPVSLSTDLLKELDLKPVNLTRARKLAKTTGVKELVSAYDKEDILFPAFVGLKLVPKSTKKEDFREILSAVKELLKPFPILEEPESTAKILIETEKECEILSEED